MTTIAVNWALGGLQARSPLRARVTCGDGRMALRGFRTALVAGAGGVWVVVAGDGEARGT